MIAWVIVLYLILSLALSLLAGRILYLGRKGVAAVRKKPRRTSRGMGLRCLTFPTSDWIPLHSSKGLATSLFNGKGRYPVTLTEERRRGIINCREGQPGPDLRVPGRPFMKRKYPRRKGRRTASNSPYRPYRSGREG